MQRKDNIMQFPKIQLNRRIYIKQYPEVAEAVASYRMAKLKSAESP